MTSVSPACIIAPSLLSADIMHLGAELEDVERGGADWHHVDVMDGHFVPNLTFGLPLIASLKKTLTCPLDVHIMVSNPDVVAPAYLDAGADLLTFHVEAAIHPHRLVQTIRHRGRKPGIALNPGTPVETIFPLLDDLHHVLLMSVNPGFGGQSFIPYAEEKCRTLYQVLAQRGLVQQVMIEVDGGMTPETVRRMAGAGARAFVAGSWVYGQDSRATAIAALRQAAHTAL